MIEQSTVEAALAAGLEGGADFAEVFVEDRRSTSAVLDDGRVEDVASGRDRGAGVRVVVGGTTGFAHTADLSEASLVAAARDAAAGAVGSGNAGAAVELNEVHAPNPNPVSVLPEEVDKAHKVALLGTAEQAARAAGAQISQVSARYSDSRRRILVANTDGVRQQPSTFSRLHDSERNVESRGGVGWLADSDDAGSQGCDREHPGAQEREEPTRHSGSLCPADNDRPTGPTNGLWAACDWLYCRDGRWRPVEPGTFPLAHGAASRVGRLRAYGNAINAKAAQAFIEAVMEAA